MQQRRVGLRRGRTSSKTPAQNSSEVSSEVTSSGAPPPPAVEPVSTPAKSSSSSATPAKSSSSSATPAKPDSTPRKKSSRSAESTASPAPSSSATPLKPTTAPPTPAPATPAPLTPAPTSTVKKSSTSSKSSSADKHSSKTPSVDKSSSKSSSKSSKTPSADKSSSSSKTKSSEQRVQAPVTPISSSVQRQQNGGSDGDTPWGGSDFDQPSGGSGLGVFFRSALAAPLKPASSELSDLLVGAELGEYRELFRQHNVNNVSVLAALSHDDIRDMMPRIGDRCRLQQLVDSLRQPEKPSPPVVADDDVQPQPTKRKYVRRISGPATATAATAATTTTVVSDDDADTAAPPARSSTKRSKPDTDDDDAAAASAAAASTEAKRGPGRRRKDAASSSSSSSTSASASSSSSSASSSSSSSSSPVTISYAASSGVRFIPKLQVPSYPVALAMYVDVNPIVAEQQRLYPVSDDQRSFESRYARHAEEPYVFFGKIAISAESVGTAARLACLLMLGDYPCLANGETHSDPFRAHTSWLARELKPFLDMNGRKPHLTPKRIAELVTTMATAGAVAGVQSAQSSLHFKDLTARTEAELERDAAKRPKAYDLLIKDLEPSSSFDEDVDKNSSREQRLRGHHMLALTWLCMSFADADVGLGLRTGTQVLFDALDKHRSPAFDLMHNLPLISKSKKGSQLRSLNLHFARNAALPLSMLTGDLWYGSPGHVRAFPSSMVYGRLAFRSVTTSSSSSSSSSKKADSHDPSREVEREMLALLADASSSPLSSSPLRFVKNRLVGRAHGLNGQSARTNDDWLVMWSVSHTLQFFHLRLLQSASRHLDELPADVQRGLHTLRARLDEQASNSTANEDNAAVANLFKSHIVADVYSRLIALKSANCLPLPLLFTLLACHLFYDAKRPSSGDAAPLRFGVPSREEFYAPVTGYCMPAQEIVDGGVGAEQSIRSLASCLLSGKKNAGVVPVFHALPTDAVGVHKGFGLYLRGVAEAEIARYAAPEWCARLKHKTEIKRNTALGTLNGMIWLLKTPAPAKEHRALKHHLGADAKHAGALFPVAPFVWVAHIGDDQGSRYWLEIDARHYGNVVRYVRYTADASKANVAFKKIKTGPQFELQRDIVLTRLPEEQSVLQRFLTMWNLVTTRDVVGEELIVHDPLHSDELRQALVAQFPFKYSIEQPRYAH